MKKITYFYLTIILAGMVFSSCDKLLGEYEVDWAPVNINIEAVDNDGNSIISPEMQGMTLTFKGETYEVLDAEKYYETPQTKAYLAILHGLFAVPMYEVEGKTVYRLQFGEIDGAADMDEDIVLNWPDGTTDTIHYHCSDHRERNLKCKRSWKLNGKAHEGNTFRFSGKFYEYYGFEE